MYEIALAIRTVFSTDLQINRINQDAVLIVVEYCKAGNQNMEQALHLLFIEKKAEGSFTI